MFAVNCILTHYSHLLRKHLVTSVAASFDSHCHSPVRTSATFTCLSLRSHPTAYPSARHSHHHCSERLSSLAHSSPTPWTFSATQVSHVLIAQCKHSPTLTLPCTKTSQSPVADPLPGETFPVQICSPFVNKLTVNLITPVFCVFFWVHFCATHDSMIWPDMEPADPIRTAVKSQGAMLGAHEEALQYLDKQYQAISGTQEKILHHS